MTQYQIINTCSTSVLTNAVQNNNSLRDLLVKWGNAKNEAEIPKEEYSLIVKHWETQIDLWTNYDTIVAKQKSAELNSLMTWQELRNVNTCQCFCYLIHTDTVLGQMSAQLVEEWMKKQGFQGVTLVPILNLSTATIDSFEAGLSYFAKWAFETVIKSKDLRYIFNIAGGFKSVSGFAQLLGQFLADETIYIFEGGNNILSIPKLPIEWKEIASIQEFFDDYRRVSLGLPLVSYEHLNPLWVKNGIFSPWGQLAWENAKQTLYEREVYSFVCDDVKEGTTFRKSLEGLDKVRIKYINERLDDLFTYMISGRQSNIKRLDYKKLKGKHECSHECDAWSDQDAKRLFCNERDGKIVVEFLGNALH